MSQLRKHLAFTWRHRFRMLREKWRHVQLGQRVHIDANVQFFAVSGNISIGDDAVIKEGARICSCNETAQIKVGARTTIGYHTFIFASENITIGDDCLIAPFVYIVDSNHRIEKGVKINEQPNETAPIRIGKDVWIAGNVTILKGVVIGDGAVIAANSVVNKNVSENEIWGGSPAVKIGERK